MSLITPDFGLLFWMVVIFGILFFILAKFGFPMITGMVEKRNRYIADSLRQADEARASLANLAEEQSKLIEQARLEQGRILKEASQTRDKIIAQAKEQASEEAVKMIEHAKKQISAEKESALKEIRTQVAMLSVEVAEKVVRENLKTQSDQLALIDRMMDELSGHDVS
ncbi:MAG: F0F1 ATP synthase subunit B [Bacteroidales bacterium]|nr:F0F1 ATP synthase subunit B [Bacteroidales bacterium]